MGFGYLLLNTGIFPNKGWRRRKEVFIKISHNLGKWSTPRLQANQSLPQDTGKTNPSFPKRMKPKTMPQYPAPSLSVFWSARLLGGGLSGFRFLGVCWEGPVPPSPLLLTNPLPQIPEEKRRQVTAFPPFKSPAQTSLFVEGSSSRSQSYPFPRLDWQVCTSSRCHVTFTVHLPL